MSFLSRLSLALLLLAPVAALAAQPFPLGSGDVLEVSV